MAYEAPTERELEAWNAGVSKARRVYEQHPTTSGNFVEKPQGATAPRERVTALVRANAELARENKELQARLAVAERRIALARMRGRMPR